MPKPDPVEIPSRFHADAEPHRYLQRFKKSWVKRFRPTRMDDVFDAVDLAHYLMALDRHEEAAALLEFVTQGAVFKGNFNLWTPLGYAMVSLARLRRLDGDQEGASRALAPLRDNSFRVPVKAGESREAVAATSSELESAAADTQKWGCHAISGHLMTLLYLRETAVSGFDHSGTYPTDELDAAVAECLTQLRAKVG